MMGVCVPLCLRWPSLSALMQGRERANENIVWLWSDSVAILIFFSIHTGTNIPLDLCGMLNTFKIGFPFSSFPGPLIMHICSCSVHVLILKHIGRGDSKRFQGVYSCIQGKKIEDGVKINLSFCIAVSLSNQIRSKALWLSQYQSVGTHFRRKPLRRTIFSRPPTPFLLRICKMEKVTDVNLPKGNCIFSLCIAFKETSSSLNH